MLIKTQEYYKNGVKKMQRLSCEVCGSGELVKENGMFVCTYCGAKYSVEEVRKMLGTVTIDKSKDVENWLIIAKREGNEGNTASASKYYGMILEQEPDNWEAYYFQRFYQINKCKVSEIVKSVGLLTKSVETTVKLIDKAQINEEEKREALDRVFESSMKYAEAIGKTEKKQRENKLKETGMSSFSLNLFGMADKLHKTEWIIEAEKIYTLLETILYNRQYDWMRGETIDRLQSRIWARNYSFVDQYGFYYTDKDKQALAQKALRYINADSSWYDEIKNTAEGKKRLGIFSKGN